MAHRRQKSFTSSNASPSDRNDKARIEFFAKCYNARHRQGRQHKGPLTRAYLDVLRALLWTFHNSRSGLCIPAYEAIAAAAGCARSTVAEAIDALECAGIITWVHRLKRAWCGAPDLFGKPTQKVVRTSNSYAFHKVGCSKSEIPTGTPNQASDSLSSVRQPQGKAAERSVKGALGDALAQLGRAIAAKSPA